MKNKNGIYIIGVDHGYGNIKTANCCFPTGVESSDTEPAFKDDLLIYQGRYYQIGVGHKEYAAEKVMDEDYYILLRNFFPIDPSRIVINSDICATAKGYEYMAEVQNVTGGVK